MSMMRAAILSVSGPVLTRAERCLLDEIRPWGVILMGRSIRSRAQVRRLVDEIWETLERPCLVFTDQEGGRVARLKAPEWPTFPTAETFARLYDEDAALALEATFLSHRLMATELAALGIHADCAPVCDLRVPGAHDIVGDRAFGHEPAKVANLARAAMEGLHSGGVASVIKHIPGHGRAFADSHEELPVVSVGRDLLDADLAAFAAVNDAPMAMTAHIAYEAIDPGVAATHSVKLISEVIRQRIGFDGLLMSDDLGMKALGGMLAERAERALDAGCDVVLHCSGFLADHDEILAEMREVGEAARPLEGLALERARAAERMTTGWIDPRFEADAVWESLRAILRRPMEAVA